MVKRNTREILVNEGIKALIENGYEGVGIQQILGAVGVPKGSFYNHFESKESFALEVLETYDCRYKQFVADNIFGEGRALDRLRGYFAALEIEMSQAGPFAGCLYGVLSQTSAQHSAPLQARLKQAFSNWRDNLTHLL
ncbi:MAG: TetR/AcrR family transcriptional regulator, partial [Alphaproteobacteria bacterium]|nr:TetR/AcrR family transcriptional regulator [Alphaproteobacteria bacterium]